MATIVEAIKEVLSNSPEGLSSVEIYNCIIEAKTYVFNAISPQAIVNGMIRRHCFGLDFPTSSPHKFFKIVGTKNGKTLYSLYSESDSDVHKDTVLKQEERELLPEEKMQEVYNEHISSVKSQLMNAILNASPAFFEQLVVELLLKMGYGYDKNSGRVTRYTKDGGVDGIIEEDNLGLDKIYIQAKRYNIKNKVTTAEVDQFATAMGKMSVSKGVFITTSDFVKTVRLDYAKPMDGKTIRLINGDELMNYLIKYEIGVKNVKIYQTFIIDENYFSQ